MKRSLTATALALSLSACVPAHTWQPGPGMAAADFEHDQAQCATFARHSGNGGFVLGPPAFIIGAAIGHAVSESNRTQADMNDCLTIAGWRAVQ